MKRKNTISYSNCLKYLNNLPTFSGELSNASVKKALKIMNNFQNELNVIHITGTNGKGSVQTYLKNIYMKAGYKVATFSSPCILDIKNCIHLNNNKISSDDFALCFFEIKEISEKNKISLTRFEFLSLIALLFMYKKNVDLALVEVGIGSPHDSTNVFSKKTTVFTKIDTDHSDILGNNPLEVAKSKSELITKNSKVIIGKNNKEVVSIISDKANVLNSLVFSTDEYEIINLKNNKNLNTFEIKGKDIKLNFSSKILGRHQRENALTAICTVKALSNDFKVDNKSIVDGINSAFIPLRSELIKTNYLIDGAHNPSGIKALIKLIKDVFPNKKIITVFGVLADKDYEEMLSDLEQISDKIFFTKPVSKRAFKWYNKESYFPNYKEAINRAIEFSKKYESDSTIILISGSLYLCSFAREYILNNTNI